MENYKIPPKVKGHYDEDGDWVLDEVDNHELTDLEEYEREQWENLRREEELKDAFNRMGEDGC